MYMRWVVVHTYACVFATHQRYEELRVVETKTLTPRQLILLRVHEHVAPARREAERHRKELEQVCLCGCPFGGLCACFVCVCVWRVCVLCECWVCVCVLCVCERLFCSARCVVWWLRLVGVGEVFTCLPLHLCASSAHTPRAIDDDDADERVPGAEK